ncbi:MAG: TRAP transporter small permease [Synergistaceae bacterium]|jgi:TRAP-type C4-dicarboxylate transport system permease small subunit|nr:TRAP transporter small permease [Synergistaceae bacterium]
MRKLSDLSTKLAQRMDKAISALLFLFLLVMTTVTFAQVCSRYLLGFSIMWSEELCRYLFIWSIFIAVPSLIFHAGMTSFDMLYARAGGNLKKTMYIVIAFGEIFFLWLLYQGGYPFMMRQWSQIATSIPISMALVYAVVPISACLGMFIVFERVLHAFCGGESFERESLKGEGSK